MLYKLLALVEDQVQNITDINAKNKQKIMNNFADSTTVLHGSLFPPLNKKKYIYICDFLSHNCEI